MSSKRAKRRKRRENWREDYDPQENVPIKEEEEEPEYVRLPGQRWVRIGSGFLLVGGLLIAVFVWYALNQIKDISADEFIALTGAYGQTPLLYVTSLSLESIVAVFDLAFGFTIFRNARDPFFAKKTIIMCCILIVLELGINIYIMSQSTTGFQIMTLFYGCAFPICIIYGARKNQKFAEKHPDYIPPPPTQMF